MEKQTEMFKEKLNLPPVTPKLDEQYFPITDKGWPAKYPKGWEAYEEFLKGRALKRIPYILRSIETELGWLIAFFYDRQICFWIVPTRLPGGERFGTNWHWEFDCDKWMPPGYPGKYPVEQAGFKSYGGALEKAVEVAWISLEDQLNGRAIPKVI